MELPFLYFTWLFYYWSFYLLCFQIKVKVNIYKINVNFLLFVFGIFFNNPQSAYKSVSENLN